MRLCVDVGDQWRSAILVFGLREPALAPEWIGWTLLTGSSQSSINWLSSSGVLTFFTDLQLQKAEQADTFGTQVNHSTRRTRGAGERCRGWAFDVCGLTQGMNWFSHFQYNLVTVSPPPV